MTPIAPRTLRVLGLALVSAALMTACGGTKVYDTSKTIVYNDTIYQVTNVQSIRTTKEAVMDDRSAVNLKNKDRSAIEDMIDGAGDEGLFVRMAFQLDDQEMVYRATRVDSWRDYSRMQGDFERAGKDIAKLMSEKKTAQLKLR